MPRARRLRLRPSRVLLRYLLFQIPGWILALAAAVLAVRFVGLDPVLAGFAVLLFAAKDLALYPLVRTAYAPGPPGGAEALVGREGVVERPVDPRGTVLLGPERYTAELAEGSPPLPAGTPVRVVAVEGLTLRVVPAETAAPVGAIGPASRLG